MDDGVKDVWRARERARRLARRLWLGLAVAGALLSGGPGLSRAAAAEPAPDAGAPAAAPTEKAAPVPHALWRETQDGERRIVSSHELELALPAQSELQRTRSARLHFGVKEQQRRAAPDCTKGEGVELAPFLDTKDGRHYVKVGIPEFERLAKVLEPTFWEAVVFTHRARLCFVDQKEEIITELAVELAEPRWALGWAILTVVLTWLCLGRLARSHIHEVRWWNPLGIAIDRSRRYSLSLAQSLLWTYVTAFGIVYVWKITERFLDITPQVLILLGIGGGTALLTNSQKLARWREIPEEYREMIQTAGKPRLSDLVTEDGVPSVPKAQMLIFTILISFTVVKQIWESYAFPSLSDGLVALMGISSALYVGNAVQKSDTLETVREKIKAYEAKNASMPTASTGTASTPAVSAGTDREKADLIAALRNYLL